MPDDTTTGRQASPPPCRCFFCGTGREHPSSHRDWYPISAFLMVPESLDPADLIRREACATCGHERTVS